MMSGSGTKIDQVQSFIKLRPKLPAGFDFARGQACDLDEYGPVRSGRAVAGEASRRGHRRQSPSHSKDALTERFCGFAVGRNLAPV
jgi:hypothetical protein